MTQISKTVSYSMNHEAYQNEFEDMMQLLYIIIYT